MVEAFGDRMVETLNSGALALMLSVGHRTGLFDTMADMPAATSVQIAEKAGLDERYVREWLGAMTVGNIVENDPAGKTYYLPREHAASLCRKSSTDNIAVFAQYIPLLGSVEDDIVHCFRNGGGVPYERFERFHEVMAEDSGQSVVPALESDILPLVPGLFRAASLPGTTYPGMPARRPGHSGTTTPPSRYLTSVTLNTATGTTRSARCFTPFPACTA